MARKKRGKKRKNDADSEPDEEAVIEDPDHYEAGMFSVNRILDHRVGPRGEIEYEVEWKEKKADGTLWPNDWLGAKDVTPDVIEQYNTKRGHGVPSRKAEIDISLLVPEVRLSLANVMMKGAPTRNGFNGPNRPRVHKLPLGCLCIESVARGFLDMMRKQGGPPIALDKGNVGEDDAWWQLQIKELSRISAFCNLQHVKIALRCFGNMRLTGTRAHSGDLMVIGPPLVVTVKQVRPSIVATTLEFPSIHVNGSTGRLTYPHMGSGMLKSEHVRRLVIAHVRDTLPAQHPLRLNGWAALPGDVAALAVEYAVAGPDGEVNE